MRKVNYWTTTMLQLLDKNMEEVFAPFSYSKVIIILNFF